MQSTAPQKTMVRVRSGMAGPGRRGLGGRAPQLPADHRRRRHEGQAVGADEQRQRAAMLGQDAEAPDVARRAEGRFHHHQLLGRQHPVIAVPVGHAWPGPQAAQPLVEGADQDVAEEHEARGVASPPAPPNREPTARASAAGRSARPAAARRAGRRTAGDPDPRGGASPTAGPRSRRGRRAGPKPASAPPSARARRTGSHRRS